MKAVALVFTPWRVAPKIIALSAFFLSACTSANHANTSPGKTAVAVLVSKDTNAKTTLILNKDSMIYEYEDLTAVDKDCKDCHLSLKYPLVKNKPALHKAIELTLYSYVDKGDDKEEFKKYFKKYAKTYSVSDTDVAADTDLVLYTELDISVAHQDDRLITLDLAEATSGGAHPNYQVSFITWDAKADKKVGLDDIFVKNYRDRLNEIAEKIFTKDVAAYGKTVADYRFENDVFALNDNYELTPKGIYFFYNNYEIASYAEGTTELLIPYSSIKHLLRPNTVITQYIK